MSSERLIVPILAILLFVSVTSCSQEVLQSDTVTMGGLVYKVGDNHPFTGTVVGKGREDYRRVAYVFKKTYKDGVQDGDTVFLYPDGKLESKVPYKNGKVDGFALRYWPNGKPKARIHFVDGQRGGVKGEMFWDENGRPVQS
jgi:hypothetical protein